MNPAKTMKVGFLLLLSLGLLAIGVWIAGIDNVFSDLMRFPAWTLVGVLLALMINLVLVSLRLGQLLTFFGVSVPFSVAAKASLQGHFASLFFISLFGQVVGRQTVLTRYGTKPISISALTAIERAILFAVSAAMSLLGAIWIFDERVVGGFLETTSLAQMFCVVLLALAASLWFGRTTLEKTLFFGFGSRRNFLQVAGVVAITFLAQSCVLSAFVFGGLALAPNVDVWSLLAAAAVTSFAASLPISVNGWGVRELAAVYAFGVVGVSPSTALAISVLVGLSSTAVVLMTFPYVLTNSPASNVQILGRNQSGGSLPIEKLSAWGISTAVALLIFFQIHIPLQGGVLNLNLADPFAILALAAVASQVFFTRHGPRWTVPHFNLILGAVLLLLFFSFLNGLQIIGVTQWALAGRLLGWLVLLGYLSIGVLTITYLGKLGSWRFVETLVTTSAVIILFHAIVRWMGSIGWVDEASLTANFEGFSGNRNAFAFQLLCCSVLLCAYAGRQRKGLGIVALGKFTISRSTLIVAVHGLILAGVVFTGSKAGMLTAVLLLLFAGAAGFVDRAMLLRSVVFGLFAWLTFVVLLPVAVTLIALIGETSGSIVRSNISVQSVLSQSVSNLERWESIVRGFDMWWNAPWIGQGLGVFIDLSTQWFEKPTVIHSTPVWVLAEFGLVGAAVLTVILAWVLISVVRDGLTKPTNRAVVMLLGVFLTFSLVHEIFYQRVFWLVLGLCLASPYREQIPLLLSGRQPRS